MVTTPTLRRLGTVVTVGMLVAGCGSSGGGQAPHSKPKAATVTVQGTIRADDLQSIRYRKQTDDCVATGSLHDTLAVGKASVLIKDPTGKQVALGHIIDSYYDTVTVKGKDYVASGVCTFRFSIPDVPKVSGIYTASLPDLSVEARFDASHATQVQLRYKGA